MSPRVRPFRAVCYAAEDGATMSTRICPPYDVIHGARRQQLLALSEYNFVRIEKPIGPNAYEEAARRFRIWLRRGILVENPAESFYGYEQVFSLPASLAPPGRRRSKKPISRLGFLGLLRLEPLGRRTFAHEQTRSGPKEDRRKLLLALQANTSPVLVLYPDPSGETRTRIRSEMRQGYLEAKMDENVRERVWQITSPPTIARLQGFLEKKPMFIADGHHRYETALEVSRTEKHPGAKWILACFCPYPQEGLEVLPTHRLLLPGVRADGAALEESLAGSLFPAASETAMRRALEKSSVGFGLYWKRKWWTIRPARKKQAALDVEAVRDLLPEDRFGPYGYVRSAAEAKAEVDRGNYAAAALVRPISVEKIARMCAAGKVLPPKSTYFYPKASAGWAVYAWDSF